jgi:hypothetical protein
MAEEEEGAPEREMFAAKKTKPSQQGMQNLFIHTSP